MFRFGFLNSWPQREAHEHGVEYDAVLEKKERRDGRKKRHGSWCFQRLGPPQHTNLELSKMVYRCTVWTTNENLCKLFVKPSEPVKKANVARRYASKHGSTTATEAATREGQTQQEQEDLANTTQPMRINVFPPQESASAPSYIPCRRVRGSNPPANLDLPSTDVTRALLRPPSEDSYPTTSTQHSSDVATRLDQHRLSLQRP